MREPRLPGRAGGPAARRRRPAAPAAARAAGRVRLRASSTL